MLNPNDMALINLVRHLTPDQIDSLADDNLTVTGQSGMQYRIYIDRSAQVEELSGAKRKFCLQFAKDDLPTYDRVLAKVLLLQSDEELFLKTANRVTSFGGRIAGTERGDAARANEYMLRMMREFPFIGLHPEPDDPCPPGVFRWEHGREETPVVLPQTQCPPLDVRIEREQQWRESPRYVYRDQDGRYTIPEPRLDPLPEITYRIDYNTGNAQLTATYRSGVSDETIAKHHISAYANVLPERLEYMGADLSTDHASYRFHIRNVTGVSLEDRFEGWEP